MKAEASSGSLERCDRQEDLGFRRVENGAKPRQFVKGEMAIPFVFFVALDAQRILASNPYVCISIAGRPFGAWRLWGDPYPGLKPRAIQILPLRGGVLRASFIRSARIVTARWRSTWDTEPDFLSTPIGFGLPAPKEQDLNSPGFQPRERRPPTSTSPEGPA
jgi:hypothetical protein